MWVPSTPLSVSSQFRGGECLGTVEGNIWSRDQRVPAGPFSERVVPDLVCPSPRGVEIEVTEAEVRIGRDPDFGTLPRGVNVEQ